MMKFKYRKYIKKAKLLLDKKRYKHSLRVAKLALFINKDDELHLDPDKVFLAGLLHDIAKNIDKTKEKKIMNDYYHEYLKDNPNLYHQYVGAYLARSEFNITDDETLDAIKYHTSGREKMTTLDKLIYIADKLEPKRNYPSRLETLKLVLYDFDEGFLQVLKNSRDYIKAHHRKDGSINTTKCFAYYL